MEGSDAIKTQTIMEVTGCAQNVRLRSANRGNANNTWNVNTSGNANNNNATNANRPVPDYTGRIQTRLI